MSSAGRASSAEREGASPSYVVQEIEEPLPPTPTYSGESPTYQDENEPPTPTLEADDMDLYALEHTLPADDPGLGAAPSLAVTTPSASLDPEELRRLPPMELARRLAAPGAVASTPGGPLAVIAGTVSHPPMPDLPAAARLPGMESPTPTYEPDEEDEDERIATGAPPADAYLPSPAQLTGSAAQSSMPPLASEVFPERARRRGAENEELPPWKRRQRRRQQ